MTVDTKHQNNQQFENQQFENQCIQFLIPIETRDAVSVSLTAIINELHNLNSVSVTNFVAHVSQILSICL